MSDIYVVVPVGYKPPPAHTTWQGAAEELASTAGVEVVEVVLVEEDE